MKPVAVLTGGAHGLGAGMVDRLLRDGYRVEAWDLKTETAQKHPDFRIKKVDVTNATEVEKLSKELIANWGLPQLLVNNAGITRDRLIHKMSVEDFEATLKVNVMGSFLPTKFLGGAMRDFGAQEIKESRKAPFRRIIMMSSVAGIFGNVGQANYAASKAAVVGLVKSVAKEWGRFNISALAVAPGVMKTEMTETIPKEILDQFIERTPLKRMGTVEELAGFIAYLAREESSFLTGDVIAFSGGLLL